jgi:DNA-binding IclR family transcriptional regulator
MDVANVRTELPLELRVLEALANGGLLSVGPTDVQRITGASKGSVSARLKALAASGYLMETEKGRYVPGPAMWNLAGGYLRTVLRQTEALHSLSIQRLAATRQMVDVLLSAIPGQEIPPPSSPPSGGEA